MEYFMEPDPIHDRFDSDQTGSETLVMTVITIIINKINKINKKIIMRLLKRGRPLTCCPVSLLTPSCTLP